MGWFDSDSDVAQSYDQVPSLYAHIFIPLSLRYNNAPPHEAHLSHELLGGAAAFEAAKAYEDHCAANGNPDSHAKAKELLAGFVGAFVDREVETKGLDFIDREKAKHHAKKLAEEQLAQDY